ncbi:MAG: OB-fold protein [Chloroflexota bacterium]
MKPFTKFLYIIAILAVAGLIGGIYMFNKPQANLQNQKADFILTAVELHKEFTADEPAANQKYIGKSIEITGRVTSVNIEKDKAVSVILETSDKTSSVICNFRESVDPKLIDTLKPVTVRGELSGFLMDVLLNNCVLIK